MPGGRPQSDAERGRQSQRKHGVIRAGIEDGPCEEARAAAGPEDANMHERTPTNGRKGATAEEVP
jgi:hypothetical protein